MVVPKGFRVFAKGGCYSVFLRFFEGFTPKLYKP